MVGKAIENPLYGIELGSIVTESGRFLATVLKPGLTKFIPQQSAAASMSGTSEYVYSDQMNQGSFSCAINAGVSGLAKVSGSIAGYIGNTAAKSDKTLSINLNLIKWAGIEHVAFNEINAAQLLAGLQSNAQAAAAAALEKFVAVENAKKDKTKPQDAVDKLTAAWVLASEQFFLSFGTGLVVGVVWGGWGAVQLDFQASGEQSKWQGGGNASFSYAGPTVAVDVAATYGRTTDTMGQKATASVSYFVSGACVQADIKAWFDDLQKKASTGLEALGKEPVSRAATMSAPIAPPKIPALNHPKPDKKITDLIGNIDSLEGLDAYAQAAAFEKQKKEKGGTESLKDFLAAARKPNDVSAIPNGALSPLGNDPPAAGPHAHAMAAFAADADHGDKPKAPAGPNMSDYEPMGIWTLEWGQLFPWLVSGRDNRIPPNAAFRDMIRVKTMHQDFLSLWRLYARIDATGAKFQLKGVAVDFKQIGNAFAHGAAVITDFLMAPRRPGTELNVRPLLDAVVKRLGADAAAIYQTWDTVASLRQCELGAGPLFATPKTDEEQEVYTIGSITSVQGSKHLAAVPAAFDPKIENFDAFSQVVKGWPLILPNRRVVIFVTDGVKENSGILVGAYFDGLGASIKTAGDLDAEPIQEVDENDADYVVYGNDCPLVFTAEGARLRGYTVSSKPVDARGNKTIVDIYPIPFTAAEGIEWKGSALATGLGTLPKTLEDLRDQLSKLASWSFDSEYWAGTDWKEFRYSMQMGPAYIGLVDEPPNVFGHRQ